MTKIIDEKAIAAAEAVLAKGERVLLIPVKNGVRIFEVDQKEIEVKQVSH